MKKNQTINIHKQIGERLRERRRLLEYSQEYVANSLGIAQKNYSKLERGETKWTLDRIYKISNILGIEVVDLLSND